MLESGDAPNLKTTLKNMIRTVITSTEGNDGYQSFLNDRQVGLFYEHELRKTLRSSGPEAPGI